MPSRVVRRTHMFLALFFFPWMLMYGVSTLVMNHRAVFIARYGDGPIPFERERVVAYDATFPENAEPRTISRQVLASLDLDGAHTVSRRADGTVVINRQDLLTPRRLSYSPVDHTVVVEKLQHRPNALLERFHRRRGYATGYTLDTVWAVSVDLVIAAMVFWVGSGLWMWWEMRATRRLGLGALATGVGLYAIFLTTL